ncbi:MAG: hypothetical protein ACI9O6_002797 [Glaciecola sp.]
MNQKMTNKIISILLLLFAFNLKALVEQPYLINSIEFVGEGGFYVNIKRSPLSLQISEFNVQIDNKKITVADDWFADLYQPILQSLSADKGCAPLKMNVEGKQSSPVCSTIISFSFYTMDEPEELPSWYEPPEVTFYFSSGILQKRLIERKEGPNKWSSEWMVKR